MVDNARRQRAGERSGGADGQRTPPRRANVADGVGMRRGLARQQRDRGAACEWTWRSARPSAIPPRRRPAPGNGPGSAAASCRRAGVRRVSTYTQGDSAV